VAQFCQMPKEIISLRDATRHIDSGKPFTCKVVKYNAQRKTGGQIMDVEGILAKKAYSVTDRPVLERKYQNHHEHYTRNIALTVAGYPTSQIVKIHPPLIIEFEGKELVP
jgi:hypothetical protein